MGGGAGRGGERRGGRRGGGSEKVRNRKCGMTMAGKGSLLGAWLICCIQYKMGGANFERRRMGAKGGEDWILFVLHMQTWVGQDK